MPKLSEHSRLGYGSDSLSNPFAASFWRVVEKSWEYFESRKDFANRSWMEYKLRMKRSGSAAFMKITFSHFLKAKKIGGATSELQPIESVRYQLCHTTLELRRQS